jgi:hypothetical protein
LVKPIQVPSTSIVKDVQTSDKVCPFCKGMLVYTVQSNGIMLWCQQSKKDICSPNENPFGFGKNINMAYDVLCQKFCRSSNEA